MLWDLWRCDTCLGLGETRPSAEALRCNRSEALYGSRTTGVREAAPFRWHVQSSPDKLASLSLVRVQHHLANRSGVPSHRRFSVMATGQSSIET